MPLLGPDDLVRAGWPPGPVLEEALRLARELEETKGIRDPGYLLKQIERRLPRPDLRVSPRPEALPWSEAIAAETPEDESNIAAVRRQMAELLRCPRLEAGAIMPDACPAGNEPGDIPVGGIVAARGAILPSAHSADICCSMRATFFQAPSGLSTSAMLDALTASTHFGGGGRHLENRVASAVLREDVWENPFLKGLDDIAAEHLGTQGDGNHFAFLGRAGFGEDALRKLREGGHGELAGKLAGGPWHVLVTHHGSRGLGARVFEKGKKAAIRHTEQVARDVPEAACWLDHGTEEGAAYWDALQYVARWTRANHRVIHRMFLERIKGASAAEVGNEHNFVWKRGELFLHGKGATPAWREDDGSARLGLIPLNMASPILLVLGSDNPNHLSFCPHGAGRNRSRTATLRPYRLPNGEMDAERVAQLVAEATPGLDIRWFSGKPDLSESPMGYKPAAQIEAQIARFGLAETVARIEPLGSLMAGEQEGWWKRKDDLTPKQIRQIAHRSDRRTKKEGIRGGRWEEGE